MAAALLLPALAACSGGSPHGSRGPSPAVVITDDPALDQARTSFEAARKTVLTDVGAITAAASALDKQDVSASKGAYDPAHDGQAGAARKAAKASTAAGTLAAAVTAYDTSVTALGDEAKDTALTPAQAAALTSLATAARGELTPLASLVKTQPHGWDAYRQLASAQALWITRAGAGYYPATDSDTYDAMRAGQAYVVLVNPFRAALTAERVSLATATAAFGTARAATGAAATAASAAFS